VTWNVYLETSLKQIDLRSFKLFLSNHTKTKLSAIYSGTFTAAFLQNSSIVNIMAFSFFGAGMIALSLPESPYKEIIVSITHIIIILSILVQGLKRKNWLIGYIDYSFNKAGILLLPIS